MQMKYIFLIIFLSLIVTQEVGSDCTAGCLVCLQDTSNQAICLVCDTINFYYRYGFLCRKLILENCISSFDGKKCEICNQGYYLDQESKKCTKAENALKQCLIQSGIDTCQQCIQAHYLDGNGECQPVTKEISGCLVYSGPEICSFCDKSKPSTDGTRCDQINNANNCKFFSGEITCSECVDGHLLYYNKYLANIKQSFQTLRDFQSNKVLTLNQNKIEYWSKVDVCLKAIDNCQNIDLETYKCTQCNDGYYISGNYCIQNPTQQIPQCIYYETSTLCKECENGYYISYQTNISNSNSCVKHTEVANCKIYNQIFHPSEKCLECQSDFYLSSYKCVQRTVKISNCQEYHISQEKCQSCQQGFQLETNEFKECLASIRNCEDHSFSNTGNNTTNMICDKCLPGFYIEQVIENDLLLTSCKLPDVLINGCNRYQNQDQCIECREGFFLTNFQCHEHDPFIQNALNCKVLSNTKKNDCSECKEGEFLLKVQNYCQEISQNQTVDACEIYENNGTLKCQKCLDSYYYQESQNKCFLTNIIDCIQNHNSLKKCLKCDTTKQMIPNKNEINNFCVKLPDFIHSNCSQNYYDIESTDDIRCDICNSPFYPYQIKTQYTSFCVLSSQLENFRQGLSQTNLIDLNNCQAFNHSNKHCLYCNQQSSLNFISFNGKCSTNCQNDEVVVAFYFENGTPEPKSHMQCTKLNQISVKENLDNCLIADFNISETITGVDTQAIKLGCVKCKEGYAALYQELSLSLTQNILIINKMLYSHFTYKPTQTHSTSIIRNTSFFSNFHKNEIFKSCIAFNKNIITANQKMLTFRKEEKIINLDDSKNSSLNNYLFHPSFATGFNFRKITSENFSDQSVTTDFNIFENVNSLISVKSQNSFNSNTYWGIETCDFGYHGIIVQSDNIINYSIKKDANNNINNALKAMTHVPTLCQVAQNLSSFNSNTHVYNQNTNLSGNTENTAKKKFKNVINNPHFILGCQKMTSCNRDVYYTGMCNHDDTVNQICRLNKYTACSKCVENNKIVTIPYKVKTWYVPTVTLDENLMFSPFKPTCQYYQEAEKVQPSTSCHIPGLVQENSSSFVQNCGVQMVLDLKISPYSDTSQTPNPVCIACLPKFKATISNQIIGNTYYSYNKMNVQDATFVYPMPDAPNYDIDKVKDKLNYKYITQCSQIINCRSSNEYNKCEFCNEGYVLEYNSSITEPLKTTKESCVVNTIVGCVVGEANGICYLCDKGYILNEVNTCDKIQEIENCKEQGIYDYYPKAFDYLRYNPFRIGCIKCDNDMFSVTFQFKPKICIKNVQYPLLIPITQYSIKDCQQYSLESNQVRCYMCSNNKYLIESKTECIDESISNCQSYEKINSNFICKKCKNKFYLENNECKLGQIENCLVYHNQYSCQECEQGLQAVRINNDLQTLCFNVQDSIKNCKTYNAIEALNGILNCQQCNPQSYQVSFVLAVSTCSSFSKIENCLEYNIGSSVKESNFHCKRCQEGYYTFNEEFKSSCKQITGYPIANCQVYSINADQCLNCLKNFFIKSNICEANPSGIFQCRVYKKRQECEECQQNYYIKNKKCEKIPDEKIIPKCYTYERDQNCKLCEEKYKLINNECVFISIQNCTSVGFNEQCKQCQSGFENIDNQCIKVNIQNCQTFRDVNFCETCKSGYYQTDGKCIKATTITDCIAYSSNTQCQQCEKKKLLKEGLCNSLTVQQEEQFFNENCFNYKEEQTCVICEDGYYFNDNNACELCPNISEGCAQCDPFDQTSCLICKSGYYQKKDKTCHKASAITQNETENQVVILNDNYLDKKGFFIGVLIILVVI